MCCWAAQATQVMDCSTDCYEKRWSVSEGGLVMCVCLKVDVLCMSLHCTCKLERGFLPEMLMIQLTSLVDMILLGYIDIFAFTWPDHFGLSIHRSILLSSGACSHFPQFLVRAMSSSLRRHKLDDRQAARAQCLRVEARGSAANWCLYHCIRSAAMCRFRFLRFRMLPDSSEVCHHMDDDARHQPELIESHGCARPCDRHHYGNVQVLSLSCSTYVS